MVLEFHRIENMKAEEVILALGALAQESRLAIFRLLVKRGPDGFTPGEIAERVKIPAPTLSFHLRELQRAELLAVKREGRFLRYSVNFATMQDVIGFLTEKCCTLSEVQRDSSLCAAQAPSSATRPRRRGAVHRT
jgi:DNA-binding transcriptional ArsR family regulator